MKNLLAFAVPLLLLGLGIGFSVGQCGKVSESAAEARQEALRQRVAAAESAAVVEAARADSIEANARVDSVTVTQFITRVKTDTAWIPSPFDTAAIVAAFPRLVASRDSLAEACDTAIQSCWEAVAAKDSVIARLEFTASRQKQRAVAAEENWGAATRRIRRMQRWDWFENAIYATLGGLTGYGACKMGG